MGIYLNKRVVVFFVLLLVIVSLLYSSTLHAPFNFDDEVVIKLETMEGGNPEAGAAFHNLYPPRNRHLFYLSLIFNYSLGELNPFGYHLVNSSLHFFTSIVIFFIAFITIKKGLSLNKKDALSIASITTLLFSINPVHSETVNYISARAVGMSSFFYLSSLLSFILGSFRERKPLPRFLLYFLSLTFFLASVLSKETALTFPIALLLYDICFMRKNYWAPVKSRLLFFYLPLLLCSLLVVSTVISLKDLIIYFWQRIDIGYGLKQIQIIGYGIRLLLFPIGLTFDYDFPNAFFSHTAILATAILIVLGIFLAITLHSPTVLAMGSFCALWFLLTLAPTNSIFPRSDLLSERNLYLPSFGIFLLFSTTIYRLVLANHNQLVIKKIGGYCLIIFFMLQIVLLHERNLTYRSNTLLWEDTLEKAPRKLRALHNLSHFYMAEKNYAKAFITLHALSKSKASPYYISYAHSNLGSIYLQLGDYLKAENEFKSGIRAKPSQPTNHFNLGTLLASQGHNLAAKKSYEKAENLYKSYRWGYQVPAELYMNKARLLLKLKLYKEAEVSIDNYLKRVPESGSGHFVLANIFSAMGKQEQALHEYNLTGNTPKLKGEAHNNRALIFIKKKSFDLALEELHQAITVSPNLIDAHYNLGNLLIQTNGDPIEARRHLEKSLELATGHKEVVNRIKRTLNTLP
jgi:tetratricopeptide (TPR) repeat protein